MRTQHPPLFYHKVQSKYKVRHKVKCKVPVKRKGGRSARLPISLGNTMNAEASPCLHYNTPSRKTKDPRPEMDGDLPLKGMIMSPNGDGLDERVKFFRHARN